MFDVPSIPFVCGHFPDRLPANHPDPYVCEMRRLGLTVVTPDDGRAPMYTCGHLIGAGVHRSQADVDACAAKTQTRSRYLIDQFNAMGRPDWRGATLDSHSHGHGDQRTAEIQLSRQIPRGLQTVAIGRWTVKRGDRLAPEWIATYLDDEQEEASVLGSFETFDLALHAALADASSELAILLQEGATGAATETP